MPTPQTTLEALVGKLKARNKEPGFPSACAAAATEVSRLIDAGATKELTFCIKLSSGTGKSLLKILILASMHQRGALTEGKGVCLNWFSFVDGQLKDGKLECINTNNWKAFRTSCGL